VIKNLIKAENPLFKKIFFIYFIFLWEWQLFFVKAIFAASSSKNEKKININE